MTLLLQSPESSEEMSLLVLADPNFLSIAVISAAFRTDLFAKKI
ncbi:MAG: hypothetical protein AAGB27_00185 [Pseudomonadota bacterium]